MKQPTSIQSINQEQARGRAPALSHARDQQVDKGQIARLDQAAARIRDVAKDHREFKTGLEKINKAAIKQISKANAQDLPDAYRQLREDVERHAEQYADKINGYPMTSNSSDPRWIQAISDVRVPGQRGRNGAMDRLFAERGGDAKKVLTVLKQEAKAGGARMRDMWTISKAVKLHAQTLADPHAEQSPKYQALRYTRGIQELQAAADMQSVSDRISSKMANERRITDNVFAAAKRAPFQNKKRAFEQAKSRRMRVSADIARERRNASAYAKSCREAIKEGFQGSRLSPSALRIKLAGHGREFRFGPMDELLKSHMNDRGEINLRQAHQQMLSDARIEWGTLSRGQEAVIRRAFDKHVDGLLDHGANKSLLGGTLRLSEWQHGQYVWAPAHQQDQRPGRPATADKRLARVLAQGQGDRQVYDPAQDAHDRGHQQSQYLDRLIQSGAGYVRATGNGRYEIDRAAAYKAIDAQAGAPAMRPLDPEADKKMLDEFKFKGKLDKGSLVIRHADVLANSKQARFHSMVVNRLEDVIASGAQGVSRIDGGYKLDATLVQEFALRKPPRPRSRKPKLAKPVQRKASAQKVDQAAVQALDQRLDRSKILEKSRGLGLVERHPFAKTEQPENSEETKIRNEDRVARLLQVNLADLVSHVRNRAPMLSASAWRQERANARRIAQSALQEAQGLGDKNAASSLKAIDQQLSDMVYAGCNGRDAGIAPTPAQHRKAISEQDFDRLKNEARGYRDLELHDALVIARRTGARPSEIRHGIAMEVVGDQVRVHIHASKQRAGDGGAKHVRDRVERGVDRTLSIRAADLVEVAQRRGSYFAPEAGERALRKQLQGVRERAGVGHATLYTMRHAFKSDLDSRGVAKRDIAMAMGQRSVRTQTVYGVI